MRSIRFGLAAIAICGLVALGARVQVAWWERQAAALAEEQEIISAQIIELRNATEALVDVETGQRGYLLTGEDAYLLPYQADIAALKGSLQRLHDRFTGDPAMQAQIGQIARLAGEKQAELARTVELRRNGDAAGALAIVATGEGRRLMEEFREKTAALTEQFRRERAELAAAEQKKFGQATALDAVVVLLIILLVAGAVTWLSLSIRRLDELQRAREREAMHDALTALPNRRYLLEWLRTAVAAAQRGGRRLALLYVDLDGFKGVNDRFGHEAGDRVLQVTAERLRTALRGADFVARLGGDEFVAVLSDAPAEPYLSVMLNRLEDSLAKAPLSEMADGEISASIGIARFPGDGSSPEALLSAADHAMYEVKERRRATATRLPSAAAAAS